MDVCALQKTVAAAGGRAAVDLLITNCTVVDVYNGVLRRGSIAVDGGLIVGVANEGDGVLYTARENLDARGRFAIPGLIDSHIHIESSYVGPEAFAALVIPHGTSTVVADPHEIVNVAGIPGLRYMVSAAKNTPLDVKWMVPSCVPVTDFEHTGARVDSSELAAFLDEGIVFGIGEMMDYPMVIGGDEETLAKIAAGRNRGFPVDGHAPALRGKDLNAYAAAGIRTDHECADPSEVTDRIQRGMYVLLREGSACRDLVQLLAAVTPANARRCVFCSDDRHPATLLSRGHLDDHLRIAVSHGIDPITAVQMATVNAADCYRFTDRGAIAPGLRADIVLVKDLKGFAPDRVYIEGNLRWCAEKKGILCISDSNSGIKAKIPPGLEAAVRSTMNLSGFSIERLKLPLRGNNAYVMDVESGTVVTKKSVAAVAVDSGGNFVFDPGRDIAKIAVLERHRGTGSMAVALIRGYGIKRGAIAQSVAHDSHNIIALGTNDADMAFAVEELVKLGGGFVVVLEGSVIASLALPIGGLMSDRGAEAVAAGIEGVICATHKKLGIREDIETLMSLSFMALPVIPELKVTDMGLFDVTAFDFIDINAP